jgi:hypothetical protein
VSNFAVAGGKLPVVKREADLAPALAENQVEIVET